MLVFIPIILSFFLIAFWLWMFVDLANNEYLIREEKND